MKRHSLPDREKGKEKCQGSKFLITNMVMNASSVSRLDWSPDKLPGRTYKVMGKTNLTDAAWHYPSNSGTRFFKVSVGM